MRRPSSNRAYGQGAYDPHSSSCHSHMPGSSLNKGVQGGRDKYALCIRVPNHIGLRNTEALQ